MKFFKDHKNEVFAFAADGSDDAFIPPHLTPITKAEADAIRKPPASLGEQKAAALARINQQSQTIADALTAGYPEFEKLTWEDQRREAHAWEADNTTATPYIDALAAERGIDRADYLARTLAKTKAFATAAQKLVGQRQKFEDQIKAIKVEAGELDEEAAKARLAAIAFEFNLG